MGLLLLRLRVSTAVRISEELRKKLRVLIFVGKSKDISSPPVITLQCIEKTISLVVLQHCMQIRIAPVASDSDPVQRVSRTRLLLMSSYNSIMDGKAKLVSWVPAQII